MFNSLPTFPENNIPPLYCFQLQIILLQPVYISSPDLSLMMPKGRLGLAAKSGDEMAAGIKPISPVKMGTTQGRQYGKNGDREFTN